MKETIYEVTIGLPVYEAELYIRKCLLSILDQNTNLSIEVIVVDDCSKDYSVKIINEIKNEHPKGQIISLLQQNHNLGPWAARNLVIEKAKGKYIFFIDSDDYISPDCINILYNNAEKYQAEVVYGSSMPVDKNGVYYDIGQPYLSQRDIFFSEEGDLALFAYQNLNTHLRDYIWNILIRKDFIQKHNIRFQKVKFYEDLLFSADMIPQVKKASLIADCTYFYVIRDFSLSNYQKRTIIQIEEIHEFIKVFSLLWEKCSNLKNKKYYETRFTKVAILVLYMVMGIIKNYHIIRPKPPVSIIKEVLSPPIRIIELIRFKKYKVINLSIYFISKLPSFLCYIILKTIAKIKK